MKVYLKILIIPILLLMSRTLYAQQNYNQTSEFLKTNSRWVLSNKLLLNFNNPTNSSAFIDTSSNTARAGTSSVSDPTTGNLLFYVDGKRIWNKNHSPMPNGSGLLGNDGSFTSTQSSCIVPFLSDSNKYYVFFLNPAYKIEGDTQTLSTTKLSYSIVDMRLDGGLGDVVSGKKNILLDSSSLSPAMIAVPGNQCNIWLITHAAPEPIFKVYEISRNGIDTVPLISTTGNQISGGNIFVNLGGFGGYRAQAYDLTTMKISPNRDKLALASSNAALFSYFTGITTLGDTGQVLEGTIICNFDASTGEVSSSNLIDTSFGQGLAFSPNGNVLYLSIAPDINQAPSIYQFDLSSGNAATMMQSKTLIHSFPFPSPFLFDFDPSYAGTLKLYNDTIYCNIDGEPGLARINAPNSTGSACDFQQNAIMVGNNFPGFIRSLDLPNQVVLPLKDTILNMALDTIICEGWNNGITLHPHNTSGVVEYTWNDGTADSLLTIWQSGIYWVEYSDGCNMFVDTFNVQGEGLIQPVVTVDSYFALSTQMPYHTYQWMYNDSAIPGATQRDLSVSKNGYYQVIVTNIYGCSDTSEKYHVTNYTAINETQQLKSQISVYPNPAYNTIYINSPVPVALSLNSIDGSELRKAGHAKQLSLKGLAEGIYLLKVYDHYGQLVKTVKVIKSDL